MRTAKKRIRGVDNKIMQNNVIDYLNDIVNVKPDKLAFSDGENGFTFKETYNTSRSIASYIADKGIYKEPVVVFMRKAPAEIITFFGVITAGCFYIPIDEEMPAIRIQMILDNVKTKLIICDEATSEIAAGFSSDADIVTCQSISNYKINDERLQYIHDHALDIDPIYIVFTSGSTGVPKGVCACHRSVIDYIEQLSETLSFNQDTVFGNQTPLYFDACLKEVYPTLKFGATTYLIPKSNFMFPIKLVEYMNEKKINTICWVVSALTMISAYGAFEKVKPEYLHTIAFGSEVFPIKQFNIWKNAVPAAKFTNLYGPTEGTGMCCFYHVDREFNEGDVIPIGGPFKNTEILLLNEKDELVKDGEPGELCIRGTGVTLGYYNNPEKTTECFVQNPLNTAYPEIIYRTGDIAKRNEYGELLFVSRKDYQIKHMGHRIELGEIEAAVNGIDSVKLSGCIYDNEDGKIVLFYVGDIDKKDMIMSLKKKLPRYMLPNSVNILTEMPFTANGKINRNELKRIYKEEINNE